MIFHTRTHVLTHHLPCAAAAVADPFTADDPFASASGDPFAAAFGDSQNATSTGHDVGVFDDGVKGGFQADPSDVVAAADPFALGAGATMDPFASSESQETFAPSSSIDVAGEHVGGKRERSADLLDLGGQPEGPIPESASCELNLDLDMTEIVQGVGEDEFKACIIHDVSAALNIAPAALAVKGMRAGSVIVDLEISRTHLTGGMDPLALVKNLKEQAADPNSSLRSGVYTCRVKEIVVPPAIHRASDTPVPTPAPLGVALGPSKGDGTSPSNSPLSASGPPSSSSSPPQRTLPGLPPGQQRLASPPPKPAPPPPAKQRADAEEVDSDEERLREQQMMIRMQEEVRREQETAAAREIPASPTAQASVSSDPFEGDPFALFAASSAPSAAPTDTSASQNVSEDIFAMAGATDAIAEMPEPSESKGVSFADDPFGGDPFGALVAQESNTIVAEGPKHPSPPPPLPQPAPSAANDFGDDPFGALASMSSVDGMCACAARMQG
jgi:hypothetical protein